MYYFENEPRISARPNQDSNHCAKLYRAKFCGKTFFQNSKDKNFYQQKISANHLCPFVFSVKENRTQKSFTKYFRVPKNCHT